MAAKTNLTTLSKATTALWDTYWTPNWEQYPKEYSQWNTMYGKDQVVGYYNTIGNLKTAVALSDGADFPFEAITQAFETTITAAPYANGMEITWSLIKQAQKLSNIVSEAEVYARVASLVSKLEAIGIAPWDNAFTTNLANGVPLCSASNPCNDTTGSTNLTYSSLATGPAFGTGGYANVITALELFANMKDHQGNPVPSIPSRFMTHSQNQFKLKALFESQTVPLATANTSEKNVIPNLTPVFSNYLTSKTAWFIEDKRMDRPHGICQYLNSVPTPETKTEIFQKSRGIGISSGFFMGAGAVSNVGIVGSTGL
jgi:hypothetical protein